MASAALNRVSSVRMFGGLVEKFKHASTATQTEMTFSVFLPPQIEERQVPVVYWLSGLTCTDDNFTQKAGAQRAASEHGVVLVAPDTSPRGHPEIEGENDGYDFGTGAGFYLNATEPKFATNYNMYSYVTEELPALVSANFNVSEAKSIMGHSMGGHGALTIAFKNPTGFRSVSAFSPITNPTQCPWGQKAFSGYLGSDESTWQDYDACELMRSRGPFANLPILIDQGTEDNFLKGDVDQLRPDAFTAACEEKAQTNVDVRMQEGYDHSYFFIASFVSDHVAFHARHLNA